MTKLSKLVLDDGKRLTFSSLLWSKLKGKVDVLISMIQRNVTLESGNFSMYKDKVTEYRGRIYKQTLKLTQALSEIEKEFYVSVKQRMGSPTNSRDRLGYCDCNCHKGGLLDTQVQSLCLDRCCKKDKLVEE